MVRRVLDVPVSRRQRLNRALYCALAFGIIGGGIALFVTGTKIKSGTWTTQGLLIALCLGVVGGVIGYFAGRR
jgi:hypothetical protein